MDVKESTWQIILAISSENSERVLHACMHALCNPRGCNVGAPKCIFLETVERSSMVLIRVDSGVEDDISPDDNVFQYLQDDDMERDTSEVWHNMPQAAIPSVVISLEADGDLNHFNPSGSRLR